MQFRQSDFVMKAGRFLPAIVIMALTHGPVALADAPPAGRIALSPADLEAWQEVSFVGRTLYRAEQGGEGPALRAVADGTASGLCHEVRIDLETLPILRWSWRLDRAPPRRDEREREGDDQGLRLSFLHRSGMIEDSILAIQYVWSQSEPAGATWSNAFVPGARQVAARSGPAQPGLWRSERRDLAADFRAAFGQNVKRIDAICLMSDGDQTGALVEGWYGDISLEPR